MVGESFIHTVRRIPSDEYTYLYQAVGIEGGTEVKYEGVGPRALDRFLAQLDAFADDVRPGALGCRIRRVELGI